MVTCAFFLQAHEDELVKVFILYCRENVLQPSFCKQKKMSWLKWLFCIVVRTLFRLPLASGRIGDVWFALWLAKSASIRSMPSTVLSLTKSWLCGASYVFLMDCQTKHSMVWSFAFLTEAYLGLGSSRQFWQNPFLFWYFALWWNSILVCHTGNERAHLLKALVNGSLFKSILTTQASPRHLHHSLSPRL